jgi:hypothetical protein
MPWYLVRLTLGFGTSAASRAMKSIVRMAACPYQKLNP